MTKQYYRILLFLWLITISYLSFAQFSSASDLDGIQNLDKLVHFIMYFSLTFLMIRSFPGVSWVIILLVAVLIGVLIEYGQGTLTEYRNFDIYDIIANISGALASIIFTKQFKK